MSDTIGWVTLTGEVEPALGRRGYSLVYSEAEDLLTIRTGHELGGLRVHGFALFTGYLTLRDACRDLRIGDWLFDHITDFQGKAIGHGDAHRIVTVWPGAPRALPDVRVGQVWQENDPRQYGRRFRVVELVTKKGEPAARVEGAEGYYRATFLVRRFRPTNRGYVLVEDVRE